MLNQGNIELHDLNSFDPDVLGSHFEEALIMTGDFGNEHVTEI